MAKCLSLSSCGNLVLVFDFRAEFLVFTILILLSHINKKDCQGGYEAG